MRFKRNPAPQRFDERVVTKFALWPVTARNSDGQRETRWLEVVNVRQKYNPIDTMREGWCSMEFES